MFGCVVRHRLRIEELPAWPNTSLGLRFGSSERNDRTVINLRQKALAVWSISVTWEALSELRV